jgi:hypothetical protein
MIEERNNQANSQSKLKIELGKHWIQVYKWQRQILKQNQQVDSLYMVIEKKRNDIKQLLRQREEKKVTTRIETDLNLLRNGSFVRRYGVQLYPFINLHDRRQKDDAFNGLIDLIEKDINEKSKSYRELEFDDILSYIQMLMAAHK